MFLTGNEVLMG